ncbi:hypothetical protein TNCT_569701 [Trichonephila clavata]|uniref:Uncharacterized protein n=1 Tax=Trichonephila clavata TaxID=2740835 RepID=A0A8X6KNP3_TRICU|nr:hypothetical protein TNCT_569701 [Trichonephila clavata]
MSKERDRKIPSITCSSASISRLMNSNLVGRALEVGFDQETDKSHVQDLRRCVYLCTVFSEHSCMHSIRLPSSSISFFHPHSLFPSPAKNYLTNYQVLWKKGRTKSRYVKAWKEG